MARLAEHLFAISDEETRFARRGFRLPPAPVREHLEEIGESFVAGYRLALADPRPLPLAGLERVAPDYRGFAYEGAAMGVVLSDFIAPWRRPWLPAFLNGPAAPHTYLAHVGIGWAWARLPVRLAPRLARLEPFTRWLAVDGYGFHEGYFHPRRSVDRQLVPRRVAGYGRRAFDQGLGRSLWFSQGARVEAIATVVATFAEHRRQDLWSGVGLAATYAGGVSEAELEELRDAAGGYAPSLAQGAAFAAVARVAAGHVPPRTDLATEVFCGTSALEADRATRQIQDGLPADHPDEPVYEVWRQRARRAFTFTGVDPCATTSAATA